MAPGLAELHSVLVVIDKINGASNEVYDEIKAVDYGGDIDLYKEEKESSKSISVDGTLTLTGPSRCIISPDFGFTVSLKEKNLDLEVSNGLIFKKMFPERAWFERPVSSVIVGKHGYAVVHFSMFEDAVQASVGVALITNGDLGKPRLDHGKIIALYTEDEYKDDFHRKYNQTLLFSIPQDEPIELQQGAQDEEPTKLQRGEHKFIIPLSRHEVAVPLDSPLFIKADIGISFPNISAQVVSVVGTLKFAPDYDAKETITESIGFEYGHIKVNVNWLKELKRKVFDDLKAAEKRKK